MNAWWPNGAIPRWKGSVPSGRAEPAPPGGRARGRRPSGEDPGLARRAVFSEGRTLCVRIAGSYGWQGPSLPPEIRREAGGFIGIHGEGVRPSSRACGARSLYLMHEYQVPWLCEYHVHVGVPSTPRTSTPVPPYPCPVRTPRGRGSWWYGDDEGYWVRVR
jgi:hypothetical protein